MSEPLKVGDLVMVIKIPCTCLDDLNGHVEQIVSAKSGWICPRCGTFNASEIVYELPVGISSFVRPARCLKKIPPLSELDGQRSQEKLVDPFKADVKRRHAEEDQVGAAR